jgi:hypothetical protein
MENSMENPQKIKNSITIRPRNPTIRYIPKEGHLFEELSACPCSLQHYSK